MNVTFKYKQKWDKQRWSIFPKVVKYMGLKVRTGGEVIPCIGIEKQILSVN